MAKKGSAEEFACTIRLPELGRAATYGVYDIANNVGWSAWIDHDTAAFRAKPFEAGGSSWPRALSSAAAC